MDNQLAALFEIKRHLYLQSFLQFPKRANAALAFAYNHRISPILHEDEVREIYGENPFEEVYMVKKENIESLIEYVDECDHAGEYKKIEFYNLEQKFGGYKIYRIEILRSLEYMRIDGRFDDKVWAAIERNAPAEASKIRSDFSPEDIYF